MRRMNYRKNELVRQLREEIDRNMFERECRNEQREREESPETLMFRERLSEEKVSE